jgi:ribosomal protein S10
MMNEASYWRYLHWCRPFFCWPRRWRGLLRVLTKMRIAADAARSASMMQVINILDGTKAQNVRDEVVAIAAAKNYGNSPPRTTATVDRDPSFIRSPTTHSSIDEEFRMQAHSGAVRIRSAGCGSRRDAAFRV